MDKICFQNLNILHQKSLVLLKNINFSLFFCGLKIIVSGNKMNPQVRVILMGKLSPENDTDLSISVPPSHISSPSYKTFISLFSDLRCYARSFHYQRIFSICKKRASLTAKKRKNSSLAKKKRIGYCSSRSYKTFFFFVFRFLLLS